MKLKQIVDITKILSDRKIPDDVIKFLNNQYYSESKETFVKCSDMDLFHFIRSNSKKMRELSIQNLELATELIDTRNKLNKIMED